MTERNSGRTDVYTRVTEKIIADLEHGVRTWLTMRRILAAYLPL